MPIQQFLLKQDQKKAKETSDQGDSHLLFDM